MAKGTLRQTVCRHDECSDGPVVGHGYCSRHYYRVRRYGDPDVVHRTNRNRQNVGDGVPCPYCAWRPTDARALRKHIYRVHEDQCRVPCEFCDRRFLTKRARNSHAGYAHPGQFVRREDTAEAKREWNLRKNYGITVDEYDAMLERQHGRCAICPATESGDHNSRLHVDHDHVTGEVRGLLCAACNHMLGKAQDDPARLRAAADYLEGN